MGDGRTPDMPELEGMMTPDDVAEVVLFALTRPRSVRILTTSFRPAGEGGWGSCMMRSCVSGRCTSRRGSSLLWWPVRRR